MYYFLLSVNTRHRPCQCFRHTSALGGKLAFTCRLFQSAHKSMPFELGSEHKGPHLDTKSFSDTVECRTEFPGKRNVVYREVDNRRPPKSYLLTFLKWGVLILLAIFAYLQITRGVITTLDWTVNTQIVFPDLYEASVLELQAGLDAGHFSSVDLVKVLTDLLFFLLIHYT